MDSAIELFKLCVKELTVKHNVKHSKINNIVRDVILNEGKNLPPVNVLYCGSYGGFEYSTTFMEYAKNSSHTQSCDLEEYMLYRTKYVDFLKGFGLECFQKYPIIGKMIKTYHIWELGEAMQKIVTLKNTNNFLKDVNRIIDQFQNLDENDFGTLSELPLAYSNKFTYRTHVDEFKLKKASKNAYLNSAMQCKHKQLENISDILDKLTDMGFTANIIEAMTASLDCKFPEEKIEYKKPHYARRNWRKKPENNPDDIYNVCMNIVEAIDYYKEEHWAIWECQHHYDAQAMRFLLLHPDLLADCQSTDIKEIKDITDMYTRIGLLFASTFYCTLKIQEVPALVNWRVTEYDGLESVIVE